MEQCCAGAPDLITFRFSIHGGIVNSWATSATSRRNDEGRIDLCDANKRQKRTQQLVRNAQKTSSRLSLARAVSQLHSPSGSASDPSAAASDPRSPSSSLSLSSSDPLLFFDFFFSFLPSFFGAFFSTFFSAFFSTFFSTRATGLLSTFAFFFTGGAAREEQQKRDEQGGSAAGRSGACTDALTRVRVS